MTRSTAATRKAPTRDDAVHSRKADSDARSSKKDSSLTDHSSQSHSRSHTKPTSKAQEENKDKDDSKQARRLNTSSGSEYDFGDDVDAGATAKSSSRTQKKPASSSAAATTQKTKAEPAAGTKRPAPTAAAAPEAAKGKAVSVNSSRSSEYEFEFDDIEEAEEENDDNDDNAVHGSRQHASRTAKNKGRARSASRTTPPPLPAHVLTTPSSVSPDRMDSGGFLQRAKRRRPILLSGSPRLNTSNKSVSFELPSDDEEGHLPQAPPPKAPTAFSRSAKQAAATTTTSAPTAPIHAAEAGPAIVHSTPNSRRSPGIKSALPDLSSISVLSESLTSHESEPYAFDDADDDAPASSTASPQISRRSQKAGRSSMGSASKATRSPLTHNQPSPMQQSRSEMETSSTSMRGKQEPSATDQTGTPKRSKTQAWKSKMEEELAKQRALFDEIENFELEEEAPQQPAGGSRR